jgi:hypothetical protein
MKDTKLCNYVREEYGKYKHVQKLPKQNFNSSANKRKDQQMQLHQTEKASVQQRE